jgi:hypothetical protein
MFSFIRTIGAGIVLLSLIGALDAQDPPYPPYYPPPGYGGFGPGNVLNGQANVINASGNLYIQQEQARVEREKALQAKVDTKRKTFDEMMYEKANTPTFTEDQAKIQAMTLRRVITKPLEAEVTSGKAQNLMLPYLDQLCRVGIQGPPISLDPDMLRSVNVTIGKEGNNIGLLKDGGKLDWPLAVVGPTQEKLDPLFPKLVSGAAVGKLDLKLYTQVNKGVTTLQDELRKKFHKEEIDGGFYLEGKRFLDSLESSMKMLRQPSAAKLLNGTYAAVGRNVPELVYNMTMKGLKFAPATPGNEAPYFALHSAMAAFAAGDQDPSAFRANFQALAYPVRKDFSK